MSLPSGSSSANFAVVLEFLLKNEEVLNRVAKETENLTDATKQQTAAQKVLKEESDKIAPGLYDQAKAEAAAAEAAKKHTVEVRQQIKEIRAQAREIAARNRVLLDTAADIDRVAKPLQQFGFLAVTGIFAAANKYVNSAKEATETTIAWKKAQDSLNESGMRIGAVLAEQALPLLKEAAEVTSKIAGFIEKHPEIVGVTLKAGLLALTLGTLGKAVSGGIRLYADLKMDTALTLQLTAAELQLQAAQTQLAASGGKSLIPGAGGNVVKGLGGGIAAGGALDLLATSLSVLGGIIAGVLAYDKFIGGKNGYAEANKFAPAFAYKGAQRFGEAAQNITGMSDKEIERKAIVFSAIIAKVTGAIDENSSLWVKASQLAKQSYEDESTTIQATAELRAQERTERLKSIQESFRTEIKLIRDSQLSRLREMQEAFLQERTLRRQQLTAGLNDLVQGLANELRLKRESFENFIKQIGEMARTAISNLLHIGGSSTPGTTGSHTTTVPKTTTPTQVSGWNQWVAAITGTGTHDSGGYVPRGIFRNAGDTEFMLDPRTTKAMERIVGGQLNQANVLRGAQGGGQIVINNNQRFDGEITSSMIRAVNKSIEQTIKQVIG